MSEGDMSKALTDVILSARENVDGTGAAENRDRRSHLRAVRGGGMGAQRLEAVAGDLQKASDLRVALEDISVDAAGLMREAHALSSRIISPALMRNIDWAREAAGLEPFVWPAMVAASAAPTPVKFKQAAE
ncbi:hypothetical protein ACFONL_00090 [Camelimonas fluminis]|uniref:Uncharacterized protein n=1 Tax=Camelimonas fluminis TaxID=1576911 RepID=A0ABV7UAX9_9HYPH